MALTLIWMTILEREKKEGKRNGKKVTLVCFGGKGRDENFPAKFFQV